MPDLSGVGLVFDLDGTLVDTAPDLTAALNHVLVAAGRAPIEDETVRVLVGHGARVLIERGFAETGEPVDPSTIPGHMERFLAFYGEHIADRSQPFPRVREALTRLGDAGAKLGVCTNKPEALSLSLLGALELTPFFSAILGADTLPVRKPDPLHFHETVRRLGAPVRHSIMIGDSPTDAATARAAEVPFIAVTFGYTPVAPEELGAEALIAHFDELDGAVAQVLNRAR